VVAAAVPALVGLGVLLGAGILAVPILAGGFALLLFSRSMPRRSAAGRELLRRTLGFREYMTVAETDRQRFAEEVNLFNEYLPYAIVFKCTEKWAQAFEGLATQPQASGWYVGTAPFSPAVFAANVDSFSSSISSAIASTPGGSGSSGFSGGSSGGGVGGGGGGSW
jgi:uncharacterized membrane protein